jgi:3-phosphoshikimate 1-carboxyvinyltransferase
LQGGRCDLPIASAQVKTALLLAGLAATADVSVREPAQSRDHSERMLHAMGARLRAADGWLTVSPGPLHALERLDVPGDPSSAAFAAVAAALHPQAWVRVEGICLNPTRTGWVRALQQMGAAVEVVVDQQAAGEACGAVTVRSSQLGPLRIQPSEVPSLIDELPVLAVAAAAAAGTSRWDGIAELRVKESDRLARIEVLLAALGVATRSGPDWLEIDGAGSVAAWQGGGVRYPAALDHRMAMAAAVAGLAGPRPFDVSGFSAVTTSWPGFVAAMQALASP